jgi:hypothetical protein
MYRENYKTEQSSKIVTKYVIIIQNICLEIANNN